MDLANRAARLVEQLDAQFPPLHISAVKASDTEFHVLGDKLLIQILPDNTVANWNYALLQKLCNSVNEIGESLELMCAPLSLNYISIYDVAGAEAEFGELCSYLNDGGQP